MLFQCLKRKPIYPVSPEIEIINLQSESSSEFVLSACTHAASRFYVRNKNSEQDIGTTITFPSDTDFVWNSKDESAVPGKSGKV